METIFWVGLGCEIEMEGGGEGERYGYVVPWLGA